MGFFLFILFLSLGVWFKYTGTNNYVTANTCSDDTDFDTIIYVFSSCSSSVGTTCVTYSEDYCDSQSSVTWAALSGTTYYIFVTGFGTNTGRFLLEVMESIIWFSQMR